MEESELEAIASQLSCPQGEDGIETANKMNLLNAFITTRTLEKLNADPGDTVVEIGPGNGLLSKEMIDSLGASGCYYGIELSEDMAKEASQNLSSSSCKVEILHCDCNKAKIPEQSVDAIMAVNLLYFIDNLEALFTKLKVWLKPGGRVVFGVRSDKSLNSMPFVHYKFSVRTPESIVDIMQNSGFQDVDYAYHDEGELMFGELPVTVDSIIIHGKV